MAELLMFIEPFRVFKNGATGSDNKPTVTDITGGSFCIPSERMNKFYSFYAKAIAEGKKLSYLETPNRNLDYGVVKIDLDFRYPGDNGLKRMYSKDIIKSIARVYQTTIKKYFDVDESSLTCFVTERPEPYNSEKDGKIHDGVHLFINVGLPYSFQYVLRNIVIDAIVKNGLIDSVGTLNPIEDVVDKTVVETGNWFIYGSRKRNLEPYLLTMEIDYNGNELDISRWKLIELVKMFGIRKEIKKESYISEELEQEVKSLAPVKIKASGISKMKKIALDNQLANLNNEELPVNYEHIKALVNILSDDRRHSYKPWFELGVCLYNINTSLLPIWEEFSKPSPKYEEGVCQKNWNNFKKGTMGIASLKYWAKLDNPQEYEKLTKKTDWQTYIGVDSDEENDTPDASSPVKLKKTDDLKMKKMALEKQIATYTPLPENYENIKELVSILSNERLDNNKLWLDLGSCLFNIDPVLLPIWDEFSKGSTKYEEGSCQKYWSEFKKGTVGIATLNYWAKLDNSLEYEKIRRKCVRNKLEQSIRSPSHFDIALVVHDMFKHIFVCVNPNPKHKTWYYFNNNHWVLSDQGLCVRSVLSREVATEYLRYANECNQKIMQLNSSDDFSSESSNNDNMVKALTDKVKSANKIAYSLKTSSFKDSIVKEACELFLDKEFMDKLDNNLMVIGVQNGVIDLEAREFRNGRPDDYVSKKCKVDYIPYNMNDPEYRQKVLYVEDFFKKILPNDSLRKYMLYRFASCLEGISEEHFPILTGTGGNGKTILLEFMQEIFGEYACTVSSTIFTQKSGSASAASPEIARIRGVRLISTEETEEGSTLNSAKVKEYTGGNKLTARGLFEDIIEFKPQAHWFLACNNIPKITSDDGGTWRRILIVEFISSFVDNPTDEKYEGIPHVYKKDDKIGQKLYECREVFFSYLFNHYYTQYKIHGNVEPMEINLTTNSFRQENDLFFQYIKERIVKNPTSIIKLTEVYGDFKYWFKESGLDSKIPSNKEFKKYFEKKFGQYGNHASKTAGWKGIAILPREIDLETPVCYDETEP